MAFDTTNGFAETVADWVRSNFVYAVDVPAEVIRTPENMLNTLANTGKIVGDCDDISILCCWIARNHGVPCRFVAIKESIFDFNYNHVFSEFYLNGAWQQVDPTVEKGVRVIGAEYMKVYV